MAKRIKLSHCPHAMLTLLAPGLKKSCEMNVRVISSFKEGEDTLFRLALSHAAATEIEQLYMEQPGLLVHRNDAFGYPCRPCKVFRDEKQPASILVVKCSKTAEAYFR